MFGDLQGMMKDMQARMDESKKQLDEVIVNGEAGGIKVSCTANRKLTDISIDPELIASGDAEGLEDIMLTAVNRALEEAERVHENAMKSTASGILPNLSGLFGS